MGNRDVDIINKFIAEINTGVLDEHVSWSKTTHDYMFEKDGHPLSPLIFQSVSINGGKYIPVFSNILKFSIPNETWKTLVVAFQTALNRKNLAKTDKENQEKLIAYNAVIELYLNK